MTRPSGELGDAEALGVRHLLQENVGAVGLLAETVGGGADVALDEVVAEYDTDLLAVGKVFGEGQGVGDSAFAFLIRVIDMFEAELLAVAEQAQKIAASSGRR